MLVQRDEQIAVLQETFRGCERQRRGHVSLVTGAIGSGKTSVLESFGDWVSGAGGRVLSATASRAEHELHLGVLGQLLHSARLDVGAGRVMEDLMRETATVVPPPETAGDAGQPASTDPMWVPVLHGLYGTLLELAEPGPLVLTVDDIQHADSASLHCLLYVVRRLRHASIMVVFSEARMLRPAHPHFRAELFSQPHFSRINLPPLTVDAIAQLIAAEPGARPDGEPGARETAEHCLRMTGGNPLLTRALIEERRRDDPADPLPSSDPAPGDAFDQAVLGCLYRHEPGVRQVARALAVLDRPGAPDLLAHLLDVLPESTVPAVRVLRTSGLMERDRLRHPRIRRSILADMPADDRRGLHRHAAEVLYEHGTEASAVAEHLVAAGWTDAAWTVPVLHEAAARSLATGRPDVATACLRVAARAELDEQQRGTADAMLIDARWQMNPLAVNGQLNQWIDAARTEGWSAQRALSAVPHLLWQGRTQEADEAVAVGDDGDEHLVAAGAGRWRVLQSLRALFYPDTRAGVSEAATAPGLAGGCSSLQALTVLAAALTPAGHHDAAGHAEQLLHRHHAGDGARLMLAAPLLALLWAGRADRVVAWTAVLLDRPAAGHVPVWRAMLHALHAEAALRLGDLPEAERHARAALDDVPVAAWGVAAAVPLATLVAALTESGRHSEADRWLTHAVPDETFRTPFGLPYLAARARHHLALERAHAANADLLRCGELMRAWGIDVAGLVPWRLELARVQMSSGNKAHATQLLQEQLRMPHRVDDRTRGRALRLLATAAGPDHRRKLLSEAVTLLQGCGDRLELVRALGDTGQTLQRAGDSAQARVLVRRAYQLAQDCGASVLAQRLMRRGDPAGAVPQAMPGALSEASTEDGLSEAERRVAALAAQGHTNRQISGELFITVSTVEQHLTRVYRKLDVKRRTDLPARLAAHVQPFPDGVQTAS